MQRGEEHVGPIVEDALRAVAVMHVDVENRNARQRAAHVLRRDRDVVEIAEPAGHVGIGVVARRPAQPIGDRGAVEHERGGVDRDIGAGDGSRPGPGADRAGGVGGVEADEADGADRPPRHVTAGMDVRHDLGRGFRQGLPARMDRREKVEVLRGVDRGARRRAEIVGGDDLVAGIAHRGEQARGALPRSRDWARRCRAG